MTDDALTRRALATAAALLEAVRVGDRPTMRRILTVNAVTGTAEALNDIARRVAQPRGLTVAQVFSDSMRADEVHARWVVCHVARQLGMTYSYIGRQIGRDHATVMHAVRRVMELPPLLREANRIADEMQQLGEVA